MVKVKDLKKGEFFTLKDVGEPKESQVFIRGDYIRELKKYSCYKFNDVNVERFLRGDLSVYNDFIF